MESIFEGLPMPHDEDQADDPPAGSPFLFEPPDESSDLSEANVSDH